MLTDLEKTTIQRSYRLLSEQLTGFRPRQAQRTMLAEIAHTFSRLPLENAQQEGQSITVIEGPTGVGKSLAYLLAGSIMAASRGKKLIVVSATIALQEQLVNRDLPFVLERSGLGLAFSLAKGRGRYLCPQRLYALTANRAQGQLLPFDDFSLLWDVKPDAEAVKILQRLADAFYYRQWDGDRDQWPEAIDDMLWQKVTNDRHGCLKTQCPNRAECPFFLAREVLEKVDIIVANHDLLLADINMGGGVILPAPENSLYCIDEAHHLAKKAVNQFAAEHTLNQAGFWLDKIEPCVIKVAQLTDKSTLAQQAVEAAQACSTTLTEWHYRLSAEPDLALSSEDTEPVWLIEDGTLPEHLITPANNMALSAQQLLKHLTSLSLALTEIRKENASVPAANEGVITELSILLGRAENLAALWALFVRTTPKAAPPIAKWITRRQDRRSDKMDYVFSASPVSAADELAFTFWPRAAAAVLTSATLQSLGDFTLLLNQTGLNRFPSVRCLALDSPFNFAEQGELYIPRLRANPKDAESHTREIVEWLPQLVDQKEPVGTLVLFASRKQMQQVVELLGETWAPYLLVQGEQSKSALLTAHTERLNQGQASILFGLDSFAEGLDLPGEQCVHVIIAKLPFSMPDDPVDKTLSRWIEQRGGNPFLELSIPEVALKLAQAVGRLIRTERDYGRVTILDNRLLTRRYGKQLLAALPPFKRI